MLTRGFLRRLWAGTSMVSSGSDSVDGVSASSSQSVDSASLNKPRSSWSLESFSLLAENRSEEHTSELQSRGHLVCRLLLEKKKRRPDDVAEDHCRSVPGQCGCRDD